MKLDNRNSLAAWIAVYSPHHTLVKAREVIKGLTEDDVAVMLSAIQSFKEAIINERTSAAIFPR